MVKPKKNMVERHLDKTRLQVDKVSDALDRFHDSRNKKNTTYLKNNLEKLIKEAQSLLDNID